MLYAGMGIAIVLLSAQVIDFEWYAPQPWWVLLQPVREALSSYYHHSEAAAGDLVLVPDLPDS